MAEVRYAVYLKGSPYKLGDVDTLSSAYGIIEQEERDKKYYYGDFSIEKYEIIKYYRPL